MPCEHLNLCVKSLSSLSLRDVSTFQKEKNNYDRRLHVARHRMPDFYFKMIFQTSE